MQISAAGTTTALVLETTPSVFGQAVTFQATVQVVAPGTGVPSGTVDFFDDTGSGPQQIGSAGLNPSAESRLGGPPRLPGRLPHEDPSK